jgi:hypothetical protein
MNVANYRDSILFIMSSSIYAITGKRMRWVKGVTRNGEETPYKVKKIDITRLLEPELLGTDTTDNILSHDFFGQHVNKTIADGTVYSEVYNPAINIVRNRLYLQSGLKYLVAINCDEKNPDVKAYPVDDPLSDMEVSRYHATSGKEDQYGNVNEFKNMLTQSRDLFERIAINAQNKVQFVSIDDLLYMKSDNNYTTIFLRNKQQVLSSKNLGYYEELLSNHTFCRIHNSYLVNLKKVVRFHKGKTGELELEDGTRLEISVRRKEEVLSKLGLN